MLEAQDKFIGFTYNEASGALPSGSSLPTAAPVKSVEMNRDIKEMKSDRKKIEKCNIEPAIVKVAPKTAPQCVCGVVLDVYSLDPRIKNGVHVMCSECSMVMGDHHTSGQCDSQELNSTTWWSCCNGSNHHLHTHGYYLCGGCGDKRVKRFLFQLHLFLIWFFVCVEYVNTFVTHYSCNLMN